MNGLIEEGKWTLLQTDQAKKQPPLHTFCTSLRPKEDLISKTKKIWGRGDKFTEKREYKVYPIDFQSNKR